jgi:hypothetical protein
MFSVLEGEAASGLMALSFVVCPFITVQAMFDTQVATNSLFYVNT